jgi:serine/threonine protein kinase
VSWLKRFEREARAAASLQHPNIVKVFDFGIEDGRPYLIMAYVAGGSLKQQLAAGASIDPTQLARELLAALAHVHAAGILHRDVKPGNILLDEEGASHLTDFGIARPSDATEMTQTGMVLGTRRYLAPEVAAGEPASERSDLYSAGCVIGEVAAPEAELDALVAALTADDPAHRPESAEAALRQLDVPAAGRTATTAALGSDDTAPTEVVPRAPGIERAPRRSPNPKRAGRRAPRPSPNPKRARPRAAPRSPKPKRARPRAARRSPWLAPVAALAAIVVLAIVVVALASGGGGGRAPQVAPSNAPLSRQLDQLDRAIDAER